MLDIPDLQAIQHTYKCKNAFQYLDDIKELIEICEMSIAYNELLEKKLNIDSRTVNKFRHKLRKVKARL